MLCCLLLVSLPSHSGGVLAGHSLHELFDHARLGHHRRAIRQQLVQLVVAHDAILVDVDPVPFLGSAAGGYRKGAATRTWGGEPHASTGADVCPAPELSGKLAMCGARCVCLGTHREGGAWLALLRGGGGENCGRQQKATSAAEGINSRARAGADVARVIPTAPLPLYPLSSVPSAGPASHTPSRSPLLRSLWFRSIHGLRISMGSGAPAPRALATSSAGCARWADSTVCGGPRSCGEIMGSNGPMGCNTPKLLRQKLLEVR